MSLPALQFSFVIPVFNRPEELKELLQSFTTLLGTIDFEIVIVEDGSTITSEHVIKLFNDKLNITYLYKENSGPGNSRNYGMQKASGNYFIILDSDCFLPKHYLLAVKTALDKHYVDCFGGPDSAHKSFTPIQKAINFAMTSFITTGGIRGNAKSVNTFQPRSFNMGISKTAFLKTGGFGNIHPGEDPDLSIRLWKLGFKTAFFSEASVYHKRRISWKKFYIQVYKFGLVRSILNLWHPKTSKVTYWLPTLFVFGFFSALILTYFGIFYMLYLYILYYIVVFFLAIYSTKRVYIGLLSLMAVSIQFFGYGLGFFKSTWLVKVLGKEPKKQFPNLFYK